LVELEFGDVHFVAEGKPENPEKKPWSKARNNNKLNPHMPPGWCNMWDYTLRCKPFNRLLLLSVFTELTRCAPSLNLLLRNELVPYS